MQQMTKEDWLDNFIKAFESKSMHIVEAMYGYINEVNVDTLNSLLRMVKYKGKLSSEKDKLKDQLIKRIEFLNLPENKDKAEKNINSPDAVANPMIAANIEGNEESKAVNVQSQSEKISSLNHAVSKSKKDARR